MTKDNQPAGHTAGPHRHSDEYLRREFGHIRRLLRSPKPLHTKIANAFIDRLEADDVTEADYDRVTEAQPEQSA